MRTYESHRTGVDTELVALRVGHRHVGVDPVELHGPAVDEPGDFSLKIVAAKIQVQSVLVSLRLPNSLKQITGSLAYRRFYQDHGIVLRIEDTHVAQSLQLCGVIRCDSVSVERR